MAFSIGTKVSWTSSGLKKTGEIVGVVPAGAMPKAAGFPQLGKGSLPRDHESYVVRGRDSRQGSSNQAFWPRVSLLQPMASLTEAEIAWMNANLQVVRPVIQAMMKGKRPVDV